MNIYYGHPGLSTKYRILSLLLLLQLSLLPGAMMAAEREPSPALEPGAEQESTDTTPGTSPPDTEIPDATLTTTPPDTHATRQAPQDLLVMAVHQPENLIGKTLVLDDGTTAVTVGPVLNIRRRLQDQQLYLIVDAATYFNTPVQYAVAVKDLDRIEGDKLVIPEAPGMHLQGLDYYPEDYTEVEDPSAQELPVGEDE
jgi:hypothetical protein